MNNGVFGFQNKITKLKQQLKDKTQEYDNVVKKLNQSKIDITTCYTQLTDTTQEYDYTIKKLEDYVSKLDACELKYNPSDDMGQKVHGLSEESAKGSIVGSKVFYEATKTIYDDPSAEATKRPVYEATKNNIGTIESFCNIDNTTNNNITNIIILILIILFIFIIYKKIDL